MLTDTGDNDDADVDSIYLTYVDVSEQEGNFTEH
jgi:hypothetical protein